MAQYKQSTSIPVLVKLTSTSSGSPVSSVSSGSVTATALKADGTTVMISVTGANWSEITTGAFSSQGVYLLTIPNTATNIIGVFCYAVAVSGATTFTGKDEIVANLEGETYSRLGAPAGASIAADLAQIEVHAASVDTKLGTPVSSIAADIAGVRGAQNLDISTIAGGAAFNSSTDTLHNLEGSIVSGGVDPSAIASAVWNEATASHTITGTYGARSTSDASNISAVKAKTDNLPSDPASQAAIKGTQGLSISDIAGSGFLPANSLVSLTGIPQKVWDEFLSGHTTSGTAGATLTAVNSKTINLPSAPASTGDVSSARDSIRGSYNFGAGLSITDIAGATFNTTTDTLHNIETSVTAGGIDPTPIAAAVWGTNLASYSSGTAGNDVRTTVSKAVNLPSDPASNSAIRGTQSLSISDLAGTSYSSGSDSLHAIRNTIPAAPPSVGSIADAVWDEPISGHTIAGSFARVSTDTQASLVVAQNFLTQLRRLGEGHWKIFTSGPDANRMVLYSADGSTVLQKWDLKDQSGNPTVANVFERIPVTSIP
jgi:hypothetical protein